MILGLLITSENHLSHIIGLAQAASAKGHEVILFCMDKGTKLIEKSEFTDLCKVDNVLISLCRHSAEEHGVETDNLSKDIVCGSQFNNAMMNHEADKVLVL